MLQPTQPAGVDHADPHVALVAHFKGITLEAAELEMREAQMSYGMSFSAYVDEGIFKCSSDVEFDAAIRSWQARRERLAAMVASSAGWSVERAMKRMQEVEARWPNMTFTIFLTHSLHQLTNDEIAEKSARWNRSLQKSRSRVAAMSGLAEEVVEVDMLERQTRFGLQSKYYVCYRAWELSDEELESYATRQSAKTLYDALNANPEEVDDKLSFGLKFGELMRRKSWTNRDTSVEEFLDFADGLDQAFCKPADSDQGRGVYVLDIPQSEPERIELYEKLIADEGLLLEQMIVQHQSVAAFYPNAVNTIRVLTVKVNGRVDIIAAAMRFGRLGNTDNFSMNGMVSDVDLLTGKLATPAIDKRGVVHHHHPATGQRFAGFTIPMWDQIRELVTAAALKAEQNDFIGWDVAVCADHVSLVEGNARPGTGLIQAPYSPQHIGRHYVYEPYIKMLSGEAFSSPIAAAPEEFEFELESGKAVLKKYRGDKQVIHVPEQVMGATVTKIDVGAFENLSRIRSVRLPNTVRFVARNAFKDCTGLQGVYLGESLRTIGSSAFEGCTRLRAFSFPDTLRTIRRAAFAGCRALASVTLPGRITTVEARTFSGCGSLLRVVLPEGLKIIGDEAFAGCTSLTSIRRAYPGKRGRSGARSSVLRDNLPTTLTSIGAGAFESCAALEELYVPHGVQTISARAFRGCENLRQVHLHSRVARIGTQAFEGCLSLEEIRIPLRCRNISPTSFDSLKRIVGGRTSAARTFAKMNGIEFRPIRVEGEDAPQSSMRPESSNESPASFFSEEQLSNAVEHFQVRPTEIAPVLNDAHPKPPFSLIDGVYTRAATQENSVRIMLVGDLMAKPRQIRAARRDASYDFDRQFRFVRDTLMQGDLVVGALETLLSPRYPYSDASTVVDPTGYYNAPADYARALHSVGFDAVVNANNHMYDLGVEGVFDTLASLNRAGLAHTGLYASSSDRRFELFDIGGVRISLHSFAQPDIAAEKLVNFTQRGRKTLFSHANPETITSQLSEAKEQGADFSIVYCHWGDRHASEPTTGQRATAQVLAEAGADLIVGTHPHTVQPFELLHREDGASTACLWSAGDFIADTPRRPSKSQDSLVLEVVLTSNTEGHLEPRIRYRPCRMMNLADGAANDFAVVPCSQRLDSASSRQELTQSRFRLSSIMDGRLFPAQLSPNEVRVDVPESITQVNHQINAAIDLLEHFDFPEYERTHFCQKRELDPIVLSEAAKRQDIETLVVSADYHVYHRDGRLLPFQMHMSSNVTKLDRDSTNNKDLTRSILSQAEIPIARGVLVKHPRELVDAFAEIGTPLVVKPEAGSFGRGVRLSIESLDELREAALPILQSGQNVIVEEMFQGIDLRIAVVDGEARAATFRIPANVVGDGSSTIAELVEKKNEIRSHNDYISHQTIKFTPGIIEFLDKIGLSLDSIPAAGKRVFLHHVANISAGGDSYEVIDQVHPDLKALAVKTAALFPSALHSGVDILAQSLNQGLDVQRAIVCEVNLNNELPLHTNPVAGTPTPLGDIEFAVHWEQESREENISFIEGAFSASPPGRSMDEVAALVTQAETVEYSDIIPRTLRSVEFELLSNSIDRAVGDGAASRVSDGMVYVKNADDHWVTELSGNTVHPRAVARWYAIKAGLGEALGIPYFRRHDLLAGDLDSAQQALETSDQHWELRGVDADDKSISRLIESPRSLIESVEELASSRQLLLEERAQTVRCTVLARGTDVLSAMLTVPFGVRGDGTRTVESLVSSQLEQRAANPLLHLANSVVAAADFTGAAPEDSDEVLEAGRWVTLSESVRFRDGALAVGLEKLPWPELTEYVNRVARVTGGPGLMTMTFALREDEAEGGSHWAWLSSSSEPRLAPFLYPHMGSGYDGFDEHAEFLLTRPRKLL